jgi:hypothetical protein
MRRELVRGNATDIVSRAIGHELCKGLIGECGLEQISQSEDCDPFSRRRAMAVIMHRMWVDDTEFRWTREVAAA